MEELRESQAKDERKDQEKRLESSKLGAKPGLAESDGPPECTGRAKMANR